MPESFTYEDAGRSLVVPKSAATIDRWVRYGLRGVKLQGTWCGGSPRIEPSALADFLARVTAARRQTS